MSKLEKIKQQISTLSYDDIVALENWCAELHNELWDKEIEADVAAGKFDNFPAKAKADLTAGKVRPL
jgi:hypothetical protein